MCLAVPFKLIEINGNDAAADRDGIKRKIRVDLIEDPKPGDFVLVHAGFAIEKIDEATAGESLDAALELRNEILKISEEISARHNALDKKT